MATKKSICAVAVFENSNKVQGYCTFKQDQPNYITVQAHLKGLKPNRKYAWHIHEAGDLRTTKGTKTKCMKACAHYNPFHQTHGGLKSKHRHVGDLGNLRTNPKGESTTRIRVPMKLRGKYGVIGRSMVIHEREDDLGMGGTEESLKTGSAGARIACGVIGYSHDSNLYF